MQDIIPVLLGADLNVYNLARAFHEEYGVVSNAFGRYAVSSTKYSRIVKFTAVPDFGSDDVFVDTLLSFADAHPGKRPLLIGCTDEYEGMVIKHREALSDRYFISAPSAEHWTSLSRKAEFYKLCDRFDIDYPLTKIVGSPVGEDEVSETSLGFGYPVVVKASSSVEYWRHPFDGMKKVYVAASPSECVKIVGDIFGAGYGDCIIIQKFVEGGDDGMRVLTAYSDAHGKVRMMALGHVLLEEHTPKGLGNHCAIITEHNAELCEKFKAMLEATGYTGFSNFDIKYDPADGKYRAFELNLRQGRSNFYVTAAGINLARLLADDMNGELDGCVIAKREHFWRAVPRSVVKKYVNTDELAKLEALSKTGEETSSLEYAPDFRFNPLRFACVMTHLHRQKAKFKKYYPPESKAAE